MEQGGLMDQHDAQCCNADHHVIGYPIIARLYGEKDCIDAERLIRG